MKKTLTSAPTAVRTVLKAFVFLESSLEEVAVVSADELSVRFSSKDIHNLTASFSSTVFARYKGAALAIGISLRDKLVELNEPLEIDDECIRVDVLHDSILSEIELNQIKNSFKAYVRFERVA